MEEGRGSRWSLRRVLKENFLPGKVNRFRFPFGVAQEVGALRRTRLFDNYSSDPTVIRYAQAYLVAVENNRGIIPTDQTITLESIPEGVVINLCAGHQTNEAFGRVISILISARWGTTVGIELDAYRILLRLPP